MVLPDRVYIHMYDQSRQHMNNKHSAHLKPIYENGDGTVLSDELNKYIYTYKLRII